MKTSSQNKRSILRKRNRRKRGQRDQDGEAAFFPALTQLRQLSFASQAGALSHFPAAQKMQALQSLGSLHGNQYVQRLAQAAQAVQRQEGEEAGETDRLERLRANWGERATITVNEVTLEVWGADEAQRRIITNTLSLLPEEHIHQIPRIVVGERVGPIGTGRIEQGGNSARSGSPELQRLEITTYALEHKLRRVGSESLEVCFTLLHETGHWVDWNLTILPPRDSEEWETLNTWFAELDYSGVTQGPGERAAEAYWRYFAGRLPEEIRTIIDASPAFETLRGEIRR
jgi:hypothetical protein